MPVLATLVVASRLVQAEHMSRRAALGVVEHSPPS